MKTIVANSLKVLLVIGLLLGLTMGISCKEKVKDNGVPVQTTVTDEENKVLLEVTMKKHLDAVTHRDLETLKSTLSSNGNMQLILPGTEIINGVEGFMDYHSDWFAEPDWTFETTIVNTEVGESMGMAIVEIVYREPERDGKPYFNRMIVSYDLQKSNGQWYVVKDHASSIEKSTDIKEEV